jgi:hypothetical protein
MMYVPAGQQQGIYGQTFYGSKAGIPVGQQAIFSPGQPLPTQPNVNVGGYPVQWRFPVAFNTFPVDRTMGDPDIPSFQQLRNLAKLYNGITLCERAWFDMVPRMKLKIELKPEYIAAGADEKDYQAEISFFQTWFESPDKMRDLHSWLRMALREQTQIDELYIYKRKKRGGGLYSLELIAGDQIKPLLDDWGMIPKPPAAAFQQYPWGIPGAWFTTNDLIHYQESPAADTPYGQSRVERIIMLVNQALRKQKKDLAHFTEGNVPQGLMKVPAEATWTPDQIDAFEQAWNALLAGNASQQVRMRFTQPGMEYQAFEQYQLDPTFDKFILNIAVASYGMSMQDVAFTEDIHKSSGDSQQNVTYRRTIDPLAIIYANFFTQCMNNDFDPDLHGDMFVASFGGYDEEEDISELAGAYSTLTGAGILGITNAGKMLKLPDDPNAPYIGRVIITKDGPVFLDDMASDKMRNAAAQAKLAGFAQASQPAPQPGMPGKEQSGEEEENKQSGKGSSDQEHSPAQGAASSQKGQTAEETQQAQPPSPEDVERENDISTHLKSDQDEPFSELERAVSVESWPLYLENSPITVTFARHTPGGKDHDQKTHGDFAHPGYGAKHDKSPADRQAMQEEAKLQSAQDKVDAARQAYHDAPKAQKAQAAAALDKAKADLAAVKDEIRSINKERAEFNKEQKAQVAEQKKEASAQAKTEKAQAATEKKSEQAKLKAEKQQAHVQKQAQAAAAKVARMQAAAQKRAQVAAAKAARAQAKQQKAQVQAEMKAARKQAQAAKALQALIKTMSSKAVLYNALSGRKISPNWSAQDSADAGTIADTFQHLLETVNGHGNEEDAASLLATLHASIQKLSGQKGISQASASVLDKLSSRIEQQMALSRLLWEEDFDDFFELDDTPGPFNDIEEHDEQIASIQSTIQQILEILQTRAVDASETQEAQSTTNAVTASDFTQINREQHAELLARLKGQGASRVTWKSQCPCDICTQNNGQTRALGEAFPSGHVHPPCHEGCPCTAEYQYVDLHGQEQERSASADYKRWRARAIDDIKAMRKIRPFVSDTIPQEIHAEIAEALEMCRTVGDVREVFNQAKEREASFFAHASAHGGSPQQSKSDWKPKW